MKALAARKQELLEASAVQRERVLVECAQIEARLGWIDRGLTTARRVLPIVGLLLPLIRLWKSRTASRDGRSTLGRLLDMASIAQRFASIWHEFSRK